MPSSEMSRSRPSQPRSPLRLLAPPLPHGHERRRQTPLRRPMASRLACALAVTVDYRIYHAINQFVYHHAWLGHGLNALEKWAVPVIAVATFALWLLARPGGTRKWKLASACALGSAALALLINQVIGKLWHPPAALCRAPGRPRLGQPLPRPLLPKRSRECRLRHRIRSLSLRPSNRLHLPRCSRRHRRRPRLYRSALPARCPRRLPRRPRLRPPSRPRRKPAHRQARWSR